MTIQKYLLLSVLVSMALSDSCKTDSDCLSLNTCINKKCIHKTLMPLAATEIGGSFILFFLAIISTAGGLGGGQVASSIYLLMFYSESHEAVAMSQPYVFAATFMVCFLKFRDRHPTKDKPLIDYEVIFQITSPLLLGVSVGVMISPLFPGWLILSILALVIGYLFFDSAYQSFVKYRNESKLKNTNRVAQSLSVTTRNDMQIPNCSENLNEIPCKNSIEFEKENQDIEKENKDIEKENKNIEKENKDIEKENKDIEKDSEDQLNKEKTENEIKNNANTLYQENEFKSSEIEIKIDPELKKQLKKIEDSYKKIIPIPIAIYIIFIVSFSIVMNLLRGTSSTPSIAGFSVCSSGYFGIFFLFLIIMSILNILSTLFLIKRTSILEKAGYNYAPDEIKWTKEKCFIISAIGVVAGIFVGLIGLGGGNILTPVLLHFGVRPEVTTVCSSLVISISSFTASVLSFSFGIIDAKYSLWFMMLSFLGALIGILVVRKYVLKHGRSSLLVVFFSIVKIIALVIIPTTAIITYVKQAHDGTFQVGFKALC